jgi:glycosyltransferase involved in cell wall biosynthesis
MAGDADATSAPVLYLSHDGVLQPIGYSQVVRPILALAARGIPHTLVSLERPQDLSRSDDVERLRRRLADAGVAWSFARYSPGAARYFDNAVRLTARAALAIAGRGASVVHARGLPVAPAALALSAATKAPIVYDIRGFWIDQRLEHTRSFAGRATLRMLRALEAAVYARVAAVVSLTELGLDVIRSGRFGRLRAHQLGVCIPTCVDYDEFTLRPTDAPGVPQIIRERLRDRFVIGFVGSVNGDYCMPEMMRLFRYAQAARPDAILLCLTEQDERIRRHARDEGIADDAIIVQRARHDEMPAWLSLVEWGLLMLHASPAKAASMPTKLGEFLASGVRPIHYGCNAEVGDWVRRAGSGYSLPDLSDASLRAAALAVAAAAPDATLLAEARERARDHFSLASGVSRYEAVLRRLMIDPQLRSVNS